MSEFKCECRICERHEKYSRQMTNLQKKIQDPEIEEAIEFFENIYNDLNNVELDNDVNKAIIEGSWPTADENIKWARIRRKDG